MTYDKLISEKGYTPDKIYNVDEFVLSTVQKCQKIIATSGRKQVGAIISAERGTNITLCSMSATGSYIPPFRIFLRKIMGQELIDQTPTGTQGVAQE